MTHPHEAIPTLRVVDAPAAASWYARLGFAEDWRHQHGPGLPWFISISTPEGATLFLTEHEGDCSPRGNVFLVTHDIASAEAALQTTAQVMPWGDRELSVLDPDGNRVRVSQPAKQTRMRTLQTARCTLEPQLQVHAAEMFEVLADPAIYEFENEPPPSVQWLAERYRRLESRGSEDGSEQWLNWVVRLPGGALVGYVQATVLPTDVAFVAYELGSAHWRQGIGSSAVRAVLDELREHHGVHTFVAVLKARNFRSESLLRSLGFEPGDPQQQAQYRDEPDELVMVRPAAFGA